MFQTAVVRRKKIGFTLGKIYNVKKDYLDSVNSGWLLIQRDDGVKTMIHKKELKFV